MTPMTWAPRDSHPLHLHHSPRKHAFLQQERGLGVLEPKKAEKGQPQKGQEGEAAATEGACSTQGQGQGVLLLPHTQPPRTPLPTRLLAPQGRSCAQSSADVGGGGAGTGVGIAVCPGGLPGHARTRERLESPADIHHEAATPAGVQTGAQCRGTRKHGWEDAVSDSLTNPFGSHTHTPTHPHPHDSASPPVFSSRPCCRQRPRPRV